MSLVATRLDHAHLSTAGDKMDHKDPKNLSWTTGTPVVNLMLVAKRTASHNWVEQTKPYED